MRTTQLPALVGVMMEAATVQGPLEVAKLRAPVPLPPVADRVMFWPKIVLRALVMVSEACAVLVIVRTGEPETVGNW
jgi:hypothetical protein